MSLSVALFLLLFFYCSYKLAKFFWMLWFNSTLMFYSVKSRNNPDEPPKSFEFYHNGQWYKVFATHEEIKNEMLGAKLSRSYVYIDDNLVLMISRMRELVLIRRSIDMDLKYVNADIFKILKWARIHWRKQFSEDYKRHTEGMKPNQN